jgi:hypothetical protein
MSSVSRTRRLQLLRFPANSTSLVASVFLRAPDHVASNLYFAIDGRIVPEAVFAPLFLSMSASARRRAPTGTRCASPTSARLEVRRRPSRPRRKAAHRRAVNTTGRPTSSTAVPCVFPLTWMNPSGGTSNFPLCVERSSTEQPIGSICRPDSEQFRCRCRSGHSCPPSNR